MRFFDRIEKLKIQHTHAWEIGKTDVPEVPEVPKPITYCNHITNTGTPVAPHEVPGGVPTEATQQQQVYDYSEKQLPGDLFDALEEHVKGQGDDGHAPQCNEWQSPYPARCFDCSREEGCDREERRTWGLVNRHSCSEYRENPQLEQADA